jgi:hypothetical protein
MPYPLFRAYAWMLPRLVASERLEEVTVTAIGSDTMETDARGRTIRAWSSLADDTPAVTRPTDRAGAVALAAASGIAVRLVPRRRGTDG